MDPTDNSRLLAALSVELAAEMAAIQGNLGPLASADRRVMKALANTEVLVPWRGDGPEIGRGIYGSKVIRLFTDDDAAKTAEAYRSSSQPPPQYRSVRADKQWWSQMIADFKITDAIINPGGPGGMRFEIQVALQSHILGRQPHDPGPWTDLQWRKEQHMIQDALLAELTEAKAQRDLERSLKVTSKGKEQTNRFGDRLWHSKVNDLIIAPPDFEGDGPLKWGNSCLETADQWGKTGQSDRCFAALLFCGQMLVDALEQGRVSESDRFSAGDILGIAAAAAQDMELQEHKEDVQWLLDAALRFPPTPGFAVRPPPR